MELFVLKMGRRLTWGRHRREAWTTRGRHGEDKGRSWRRMVFFPESRIPAKTRAC